MTPESPFTPKPSFPSAAPVWADRASAAALAAVLLVGVVTGLWGIRWGLPGRARLRAYPESLRLDPQASQRFAESWEKLYQEIRRAHSEMHSEEPVTYVKGVEEFSPGWNFPPGNLVNSYRALLLQSENPDEKKSFIILSQMRPWRLEFKPLYVQYGGSFIYPLGVFVKAASWLGGFAVVPDIRHYLTHPEDMGSAYLSGRLFILVFQLGSLWVLYDLGRRLAGWRAGLCAALFFALSPIVAVNSHLIKPHCYAAFWCLAAVRYAVLALTKGRGREYLLCGLCLGVAMGANFTFLAFTAILPWLWWWRWKSGAAAPEEIRRAVAALAAAAAVCLLLNPYLLLSYRDFAWEMAYARRSRWSLENMATVLRELFNGMGPVVSVVSLLGLAAAFRAGQAKRFLALLFVGTFFILWMVLAQFSGGFVTMSRYYYPCVGLACLIAAIGITEPCPRAAKILVLSLALADGGLRCVTHLDNMRLGSGPRSTRFEAAAWIDSHIPLGATVGLTRYPEPAHTPPFRYDLYRLIVFESPGFLAPGHEPEYIVVDEESRPILQEGWAKGKYVEFRVFRPLSLGWARVLDSSFYANTGMYVYKRL
ncbi:MAG: hypothetical protein A3G41_02000 [Elusimicrobia bacterium RIFCSPLOWO2_12_FULL_59_9]|nr:MAG: hypothetical protein A3G41_02000 [Elusimicrobia bacterium RIFCSPLOWO2_12_FULL_59_9]